jgi:hypothetical protein
VGYEKGWWGPLVAIYTFYYEIVDVYNYPEFGHHYLWKSPGSEGTIYTYAIWWEPDDNAYWFAIIKEGGYWVWSGKYLPTPYEPVDLQAMTEMYGNNINIDYTHFNNIMYSDQQASWWYLWTQYEKYDDMPYYKIHTYPNNHYEFRATYEY